MNDIFTWSTSCVYAPIIGVCRLVPMRQEEHDDGEHRDAGRPLRLGRADQHPAR